MNVDEKTPLLSSSEKIDRTSLDESAMPETATEQCRPPRRLHWVRKLAYGVGHVFNDLAASMWFTYLILFYHKVVQLDNALAGTLLLIGQVVDGLATPVIGYLCDITPFWYLGFGRRKIWHLLGTILVAVSLFFFWHKCLPCQTTHASLGWQIAWYAAFIAVFQVGWASVQISHLSFIPELTDDESERVGLNAIRTAFTLLSNLGVFVTMWVLLDVVGDKSKGLSDRDEWSFSGAVLGIIAVGLLFSALFHIGTVEPCTRAQQKEEKETGKRIQWYIWFLKPEFYLVAGIYMGTRLIVNVSQVYTPLYLIETLHLPKDSVAIGPLAIYVSGFITTLILRLLNKVIGRYMSYFCGLVFIWGALMWFWAQTPPSQTEHPQVEGITVYGSTILLGAGGSTLLVTSLSMVADLIGSTVGSSAFVYGLMSFTDKVSNGIAVQTVQALHPCKSTRPSGVCCGACAQFYRVVLSSVPGGASLCALICLGLLVIFIYRRSRQIRDVAPACAEGGPCISPSMRNKTLQSDDMVEASLSQTASMNGSYDDIKTEKKPLIKRTPVIS